MKKLHATIKKPCSENWDKMTPNEQGRHCEKCAMTVIDFTQMPEEEIIKTLQARKGQRTCGRLRKKPVVQHFKTLSIYPNIERKTSWFPSGIYALSLASLLLASCGQPTTVGQVMLVDSLEQVDTFITNSLSDSVLDSNEYKNLSAPPQPIHIEIMGEVGPEPLPFEPIEPPIELLGKIPIPQDTARFAEQMPQFPGGEDSLRLFLKKHINYPEQERNLGIEGKVILEFGVGVDGSVANVRVVRSTPDGPNFEKEALRVFHMMPKWNPAVNRGRDTIPVYMYYPITFRLND